MFVTSKVKKLKLKCSGMEFASEFFIKAFVNGLQFNEIKISLKKDKRSSPPHLRRWVDGWRHLRFIYANAPDFFVVVPFILILFIYVYAFVLSYYSIENILSLPRYHTIFSLIALNQFFALIMRLACVGCFFMLRADEILHIRGAHVKIIKKEC